MSADDTVEWHTWSGRIHKFGPEAPNNRPWKPFRRAQCNRSITTDEDTQQHRPRTSICKRCFPDGAR